MENLNNTDKTSENAEKELRISDVRQRFLDKLDERITKLQSDWAYYSKPRRFAVTFTPEAHQYYKEIPIRLSELEYILKNVV